MTSDRSLLQSYISQRDAEAFGALVERHGGMVYGAALRIAGNAADAEDACQEAFIAMARQARQIRDNLPAWLHRVARRKAMRAIERRARQQALMEATDDEDARTRQDLLRQVDEALDELPDRQRSLLVLHYLEGQGQSAIAESLGCSQPTVQRHLKAAVDALRSKVGAGIALGLAGGGIAEAASPALPATASAGLGKLTLAGIAPAAGIAVLPLGLAAVLSLMAATVITLVHTTAADSEPTPAIASGHHTRQIDLAAWERLAASCPLPHELRIITAPVQHEEQQRILRDVDSRNLTGAILIEAPEAGRLPLDAARMMQDPARFTLPATTELTVLQLRRANGDRIHTLTELLALTRPGPQAFRPATSKPTDLHDTDILYSIEHSTAPRQADEHRYLVSAARWLAPFDVLRNGPRDGRWDRDLLAAAVHRLDDPAAALQELQRAIAAGCPATDPVVCLLQADLLLRGNDPVAAAGILSRQFERLDRARQARAATMLAQAALAAGDVTNARHFRTWQAREPHAPIRELASAYRARQATEVDPQAAAKALQASGLHWQPRVIAKDSPRYPVLGWQLSAPHRHEAPFHHRLTVCGTVFNVPGFSRWDALYLPPAPLEIRGRFNPTLLPYHSRASLTPRQYGLRLMSASEADVALRFPGKDPERRSVRFRIDDCQIALELPGQETFVFNFEDPLDQTDHMLGWRILLAEQRLEFWLEDRRIVSLAWPGSEHGWFLMPDDRGPSWSQLSVATIDREAALKQGLPPLWQAVKDDDDLALRRLLKQGADPAALLPGEHSLLHVAAWGDHRKALQVILADGRCPIDAPDESGMSALAGAVALHHGAVVEQLLQAGADPELKHPGMGYSPIKLAASMADADTLDRLLGATETNPTEREDGSFVTMANYHLDPATYRVLAKHGWLPPLQAHVILDDPTSLATRLAAQKDPATLPGAYGALWLAIMRGNTAVFRQVVAVIADSNIPFSLIADAEPDLIKAVITGLGAHGIDVMGPKLQNAGSMRPIDPRNYMTPAMLEQLQAWQRQALPQPPRGAVEF